jgi:hypothetical protein
MGFAAMSESSRIVARHTAQPNMSSKRCGCFPAMCRRLWVEFLARSGEVDTDASGIVGDSSDCYLIAYEAIRKHGALSSWDDVAEKDFLLFSFFVLVLDAQLLRKRVFEVTEKELDSFRSIVESAMMQAGGTRVSDR